MVETIIHRLVKEKIAEALRELGYDAKVEHVVEQGRLDVFATKEGCEPIKVEVVHTHVPNWIMLEVKGDIPASPTAPSVEVEEAPKIPHYWRDPSPAKLAEELAINKGIDDLSKGNASIVNEYVELGVENPRAMTALFQAANMQAKLRRIESMMSRNKESRQK